MKEEKCKEMKKKSGLMRVTLELSDDYDEVRIGYISEIPVLRPSYRLVQEKEKLYLQAWGIIQNLSGEDWKDIKLSLVAGSPISFETNLAYSYIPPRPMISDYGDVISSVPLSKTTLAQEPPTVPAAGKYSGMEEGESTGNKSMPTQSPAPSKSIVSKKKSGIPEGKNDSAYKGGGYGKGASDSDNFAGSMLPRITTNLASVVVEGGQTRYDIPQKITIPDDNSTMVMIFSKKVEGELSYLFAPRYGVFDSSAHPFRVARFRNTTGGLLEKGPLAIYESNAFLGQGMLSMLPADATTTVPFSIERGIAVEVKKNNTERGGRIFKVESGNLVIEKDFINQTEYIIKNGLNKPVKIILKHQRVSGTRLIKPEKNVEENVGTNTALITTDIAGFTTDTLKVEEVRSYPYSTDWMSDMAEDAIKDYIAKNGSETENVKLLSQILEILGQLKKAYVKQDKLYQEQGILEKAQAETRDNLKSIEKNPQATDLKGKLMDRLDKNASRLQIISKELIELKMRISELKVRFDETKKVIKISEPIGSK